MKRFASLFFISMAMLSGLVAQAASPTAQPGPAPAPAGNSHPSLSKDETVFAVLEPNGAVKNVIVSDWIHSDKPNIEIKDKSNLSNIENVKGYEQPRKVGDALYWKLDGSDLYYRGKSSRSLPLSVNIRYWLDGKPIDPKDLSGKSGLVRVRVEIKNLASAERIIDGTKRRIFAPMIVVVGLSIPVVGFRDLQVTGGTILTDGQNNFAAGILVPGLRESTVAAGGFGSTGIDLSSIGIKDWPLPEAFEFTTRADKFKMGSIYIAATPDFPEIGGPNTVKVLDDALASFSQLTDASKAIKDGSAQLAEGTSMLRQAIFQALSAIRPFLQDNKASIDSLSAFLNDDRNIAAARELFSSFESLQKAAPTFSDIFKQATSEETRRLIDDAITNAKQVDLKDLVDIPGAASLINETSIANLADLLVASEDLYKGMDERRLQAASDFAVGAAPLFDAITNFDETAKSYDPAAGAAIQAFGARSAEFETNAVKLAKLSSFDAAKATAALQDRARADASFLSATASLDDASLAALGAKLATGDALSDSERAALSKFVLAAAAERSAVKQPIAGPVADVLPALAEGARLSQAAQPAATAAALLSAKTLPGLATAQINRNKTDQAVAAGRKILDTKMVGVISQTVSKVFTARRAFDKNKTTLQAARSFLAVRIKSGSFKAQLDYIDHVQQDLKALEPFLLATQKALDMPELAFFIGSKDPFSTTPEIQTLLGDFQQLEPILTLGKDLLSEESIAKYRSILTKVPDLEKGMDDLDTGSALLAVKMGELAAGTKLFDETGIQQLATNIVDKAHLLRGFLKVKDELSLLARDFQTFSGAPEGADTTLKFIFKTDEIR
jgi:putative membrane protein